MTDNDTLLRCVRVAPDVILPRVIAPTRIATLYAYLRSERGHSVKLALTPGLVRIVPTGVIVTVADGYSPLLHTHLILASRGISVMNNVATTHPREIVVWLHNSGVQTEWIEHGDPIAQLLLVPTPTPIVVEDTNV